jgi:hypothetical protein
VPNAFPWRHCLYHYVDKILTYKCEHAVSYVMFFFNYKWL